MSFYVYDTCKIFENFVALTANLLILFGHWGQELVNLQPHCLQNLIVFWEVNGLLSAIISRETIYSAQIFL